MEEAITLALRSGDWKYIQPLANSVPDWLANKGIEGGLSNVVQLYNLKDDVKETTNVADKYPEQVKALQALLSKIKGGYTRVP